jgi:hypothetical protein
MALSFWLIFVYQQFMKFVHATRPSQAWLLKIMLFKIFAEFLFYEMAKMGVAIKTYNSKNLN